MPQVPVLIDLPEGWELAEADMRPPKAGEHYFSFIDWMVAQANSDFTCPRPIVRKVEPVRRWINFNSGGALGGCYKRREYADHCASPDRIACKEVSFIKGEGL